MISLTVTMGLRREAMSAAGAAFRPAKGKGLNAQSVSGPESLKEEPPRTLKLFAFFPLDLIML